MSRPDHTDGIERVDPAAVPRCVLRGGASMPAIGLGTFGSDHAAPDQVAAAVRGAFEVGYRHFDCAAVYGNEAAIGAVFEDLHRRGVPRGDLWITSKLWNDRHAEPDVVPTCRQSLSDLRLHSLDLYLVHWPFPNWHPPGCSVESRAPGARPYLHEAFMRTWRQMERLVDLGLARHIGTSNMTIAKLRLLLRDARIRPAVNEMELHPHFQQSEFVEFLRAEGIQPVGYCPLGSPGRPARDRTREDTVDMEDPVIVDIARRRGVHPAAVCLKWAVQRGTIPLPMSTVRTHYLANLRAVVEDPLTADEMRQVSALDRNCRLIKGQVFLWKPGQNWEDLWDVNGEVTT